jgi:membrane protein YdbS with pleckstrin-like domain
MYPESMGVLVDAVDIVFALAIAVVLVVLVIVMVALVPDDVQWEYWRWRSKALYPMLTVPQFAH